LMNSLLLSFPGTPIIYYGDEIGMGDNIYLGDRNGVRTPMQWAPDRNGGFSRADPARLYAPTIMDAIYGYESVNVEAQSRSLSSLLSWTKRLIAVRKTSKAFGRGTITFIRPTNRATLAYVRHYDDEIILCVANLSRSAQATELNLAAWKDRVPLEMLGRTTFPPIGELPYLITLAPYGFYWFRLNEKPPEPTVTDEPVPEFETLVVPYGSTWMSLQRTRMVFERDVLPAHLARTRWFPERSAHAISTKLTAALPFSSEGHARPWLAIFESRLHGQIGRYALPMRVDWVRFDRERFDPKALSAVRQASREGTLVEVASDKDFIALLLDNIRHARTTTDDLTGSLAFEPTEKLKEIPPAPIETARAVQTEQSNTTTLVDETYVVKLYRKLESGINPEIPISPASPTPRLCSAALSWWKATPAPPSRSCIASSRTRATPGRWRRAISTASSRSNACSRPTTTRRKRRSRSRICTTWRRAPSASPKCSLRWRAAPTFPISGRTSPPPN